MDSDQAAKSGNWPTAGITGLICVPPAGTHGVEKTIDKPPLSGLSSSPEQLNVVRKEEAETAAFLIWVEFSIDSMVSGPTRLCKDGSCFCSCVVAVLQMGFSLCSDEGFDSKGMMAGFLRARSLESKVLLAAIFSTSYLVMSKLVTALAPRNLIAAMS